ncbi:MAG: hypothetical protein KAU89_06930, partial [Candidatus Thorarchaeota archaeon]|nr:hypothetical protein [Candidatus Thorarchaeota archaeon]
MTMVVEIDDSMKAQVIEMFQNLDSDVKIHLFVKDHDCLYCNDTTALVTQIAELSDKVEVIPHRQDTVTMDAL